MLFPRFIAILIWIAKLISFQNVAIENIRLHNFSIAEERKCHQIGIKNQPQLFQITPHHSQDAQNMEAGITIERSSLANFISNI
jgi:hypothetical protein